jgi:hypothetical protein
MNIMTGMGDRTGSDAAIRNKLRLLKIGLYGFICSLVFTVFSLFFMGAASLLGLVWTNGRIIGNVGNMIGSVIPIFFAAPLVFFALLITSLLMKPREADMAEHMKPSIAGIAIIIAAGVILCAFPILGAFVVVMAALYFHGYGTIFIAMAYFGLACLLFFLTGGYALVREVADARELRTDKTWIRSIFRVLRVGGAGGPGMDRKMNRSLTRVERIVGSAMGTVLFLLFKARDLYETTRSITGHGSDSTWLDVFATMDTVLALFSIFIIIFSTLFIIRSVKILFRVRGGRV